jgi:predicted O-linked N-acetylglucosamine transferase (SPINDLY family)
MQVSIDASFIDRVDPSIDYVPIQSPQFYEAAIATDDTIVSNYWYLGLSYLLTGREDEAQAAWMVPLSVASDAEVDIYTQELGLILERAAQNRAKNSDLETPWLIRQYLWTIDPARVDNLIQLIIIAAHLDLLTSELLTEWRVVELLSNLNIGDIDDRALEDIIGAVISKDILFVPLSLEIIDRCLQLTSEEAKKTLANKTNNTAFELFYKMNAGFFAINLAERCQPFLSEDLSALQVLVGLYTVAGIYDRAIVNSELYCKLARTKFQKLFASYLNQKTYFTSGDWENYLDRLAQHHQLTQDVIDNAHELHQEQQKQHLIVTSYLSLYTSDSPEIERPLQNQIARIYQDNLPQFTFASEFDGSLLVKTPKLIRIGYLASTLKIHSVGWLSRWLFHHHDRQSFQIFTYCLNQSADDPFNHQWFRDKVDVSYYFRYPHEVVSQIRADEIDILIDLDSLTFDLSCQVMAYKPAPVQATWLGLDAPGIPAIDYFIVDPYVLPDNAQEYYQEKLWRLPQTYLGIEGFEVGIPNLTRQDLDIPADAIVYFSSQAGFKRHPDNIRCQMKIIAAVPNSYLLIKGKSDPTIIRNLFGKIAAEEGVSIDRLRFLPRTPNEYIHRANLAIADIVLDTFPYNGATTTLETLWMGIPMVTQVGKQFAARNSYTFMLNAGIQEGIAWSQEEYIDWGIKLGTDPKLCLEIREKLRAGKQTAPVWNAKQFTRDMEQAYREMWAKYQAENHSQTSDLHENN